MSSLLQYQIALTLIPGVGPVLSRNLISYCGSIEAVFKEKEARLRRIPEIGPVTAKAIASQNVFELAEQECRFIEDNKIQAFFYLDKGFPQRLRNCNDAPILLYYKGTADLNSERIIAVVGTRNATEYGRQVTEELVTQLGEKGILIISGLAYGIDICAHKAAVKHQISNIGVVGHGLDRIYPSVHRSTAAKMVLNGGILTEFPSGTNPDKENFPARNRIVAGVSDAVVVVESAEKGGALITADIANSYNRDVFAIPGNIYNAYSMGCHFLIRENKAALASSANDILKMMQWNENAGSAKPLQRQLFPDLTPAEKLLVNMLEESQLDVDTIALKMSIPLSKASSMLLNLELNGVIKALPGKQYKLL